MSGRIFVAIGLLAGVSGTALAQDFVYVNNNHSLSNTVTAFKVEPSGALTMLPGSPYSTGGLGDDFGPYATNAITACAVRNFLYVANANSNDVSVFGVNPSTGALTLIPGSPFSSGGIGGINGISLAATPDNKFLFVANFGSGDIVPFRVQADGSLTPAAPAVATASTFGMKVSPDGRFLIAGQADFGVSVFAIGATGSLTPAPGSPFSDVHSAGVEIDCQSKLAFIGEAVGFYAEVGVFQIGAGGVLTPIPGSPFTFPPGYNSNTVALTPDDKHLYVGNQFSASITGLNVAADGSLTSIPGSPFADPGSVPVTMAVDHLGRFLYVANETGGVAGYTIAADGTLSPAPGSPFGTNPGAGTRAVVTFPPKSCTPPDQPPVCAAAQALVPVLWPPDHQFRAVTITGVTDPDGDPVTITVTGVTEDEPVNAGGDGNTCPDALVAEGHASVRAERAGLGGNGRVYVVHFTADDGRGGVCEGSVSVCVPHDQGDAVCVDDGQKYDATGPCHEGGGTGAEVVTANALRVIASPGAPAVIEYALAADADVEIAAFDVAGRRVATLENARHASGVYQRSWDMAGIPSGMYFVRMRAGDRTLTKTVLRAR